MPRHDFDVTRQTKRLRHQVMIQELDRQMSLVLQTNIPNKCDSFSEFNQKDDLLQSYEHEQPPKFAKIMLLNRVDEEFFDLRSHFKATLLVKMDQRRTSQRLTKLRY